MPHPFHDLLKPCEGIASRKTFSGPNDYVDIATPGVNRVGADVRRVTDDGVEVFYYSTLETIPFDEIELVTLRTATLYSEIARRTWARNALELAA